MGPELSNRQSQSNAGTRELTIAQSPVSVSPPKKPPSSYFAGARVGPKIGLRAPRRRSSGAARVGSVVRCHLGPRARGVQFSRALKRARSVLPASSQNRKLSGALGEIRTPDPQNSKDDFPGRCSTFPGISCYAQPLKFYDQSYCTAQYPRFLYGGDRVATRGVPNARCETDEARHRRHQ